MKILRIVLCILAAAVGSPAAEFTIPEKFRERIHQVRVSEAGDVILPSGESSDELVHYLRDNWAALLDHIDDVPDRNGPEAAVMLVEAVAEDLPPLEYVGFLDKITDLYGQGKLDSPHYIGILCGDGRKNCFVGVNFEHPAIRKILERARALVGAKDPGMLPDIESFIEGDLADNYDVNGPDFVPETLPGIRVGAHRQRKVIMVAGVAIATLTGLIFAVSRWGRRRKSAVKNIVV